MTPARRHGRRLLVGAVVTGLVLSGLLVWGASYAAFTGTTSNTGNSAATGTVAISDDDSGGALFSVTNAVPGTTGQKCVKVTYSGTSPTAVTYYASSSAGTLAPYVQLSVEEGDGGTYASCTGFMPSSVSFAGTVTTLGTSYATGSGLFAPDASGQTRTFRVTYTVDPAAPNGVQSSSATFAITWEAQSVLHPTLRATGQNTSGQLGLGTTTSPVSSLTAVGTSRTWLRASSGLAHSCAVRSDGTLWCWGNNGNYRLGLGDTTQRTSPVQVGSATTWTAVAGGEEFSCGLRSDGTLWCWGLNTSGQLGMGDTTQRTTPVQVGVATTWAAVSAGQLHACAVRTDGTLWCWGYNTNGQLGVGDTSQRTSPTQVGSATNWASVSSSSGHSCAMRTDGTLWCWGAGTNGRLGQGDQAQQNSPVQVGSSTDWSTVTAGGPSSCAVKTTGTLWCWGGNASGQLGLGDSTQRLSPVQVGTDTNWASVSLGWIHGCAVKSTRALYCWGYNADGQLGLGDTTQRLSPVVVTGVSSAMALAPSPLAYHQLVLPWPGS